MSEPIPDKVQQFLDLVSNKASQEEKDAIQLTFDTEPDYHWFYDHPGYISALTQADPALRDEDGALTQLGDDLNRAYLNALRNQSGHTNLEQGAYSNSKSPLVENTDMKNDFTDFEGVYIPKYEKKYKQYKMSDLKNLGKNYNIPQVSSISGGSSSLVTQEKALEHLILDLKKDIKFVKDAMTLPGAKYYADKRGYRAAYEDINKDGIKDVVVYRPVKDKNGNPIIDADGKPVEYKVLINGWGVTPHNPTKAAYEYYKQRKYGFGTDRREKMAILDEDDPDRSYTKWKKAKLMTDLRKPIPTYEFMSKDVVDRMNARGSGYAKLHVKQSAKNKFDEKFSEVRQGLFNTLDDATRKEKNKQYPYVTASADAYFYFITGPLLQQAGFDQNHLNIVNSDDNSEDAKSLRKTFRNTKASKAFKNAAMDEVESLTYDEIENWIKNAYELQ